MIEITRTVCQWRVTAYRLDRGDRRYPDAGGRIREELLADVYAPLDHPIALSFTAEDAAVVMARAPLTAWWMPMSPVWLLASVETALADAEAIIQAIATAYRSTLHTTDWSGDSTLGRARPDEQKLDQEDQNGPHERQWGVLPALG